jgi:hypothetical protein
MYYLEQDCADQNLDKTRYVRYLSAYHVPLDVLLLCPNFPPFLSHKTLMRTSLSKDSIKQAKLTASHQTSEDHVFLLVSQKVVSVAQGGCDWSRGYGTPRYMIPHVVCSVISFDLTADLHFLQDICD